MPRKTKDINLSNEEIKKEKKSTKKSSSKSTKAPSKATKKVAAVKVEKVKATPKKASTKKASTKNAETAKAKASAKKTTVKKVTTKKATTKKAEAAKAKAPAKKTTAKKPATKKTTAKKPAAKKTTAKKVETVKAKAPAKKTTTKKATTKKTTAKKVETVKAKTSAKKTTTRKTSTTKKDATAAVTKTVKASKATRTTKAKSSTKKASISSAKKQKNFDALEYYDLPYRYNQTVVKILAQTPNTLFVYWDISDKDRNNYIAKYGQEFFNNTYPVLIVHNKTMNYSFEIEINDFANSWYFNVNDAKCDYEIELGRRTKQNQATTNLPDNYQYITSSNVIETPNNHILFEEFQNILLFKNVKTNEVSKKDILTFDFAKYLGKYQNIYDIYKKMYNEDVDEINNPSSGFKTIY